MSVYYTTIGRKLKCFPNAQLITLRVCLRSEERDCKWTLNNTAAAKGKFTVNLPVRLTSFAGGRTGVETVGERMHRYVMDGQIGGLFLHAFPYQLLYCLSES